MKNTIVTLCVFLFILCISAVAGEAPVLDVEQIVSGINLEAQSISSGEAKILFFEVIAPTHTPEQARHWLEEKKVQSIVAFMENASEIDQKLYDFQSNQIYSDLQLSATLKTLPEVNRQEFDIAFEAYDHEDYKYRSVVLDKRIADPENFITQHASIGWQRIITFDGEIQLIEKELQNGVQYVRINSGDKNRGFISCYAFGRTSFPLQVDQAELVATEDSARELRYVLKIQPRKIGLETTDYIKIWVNPETFMITREEQRTVTDRLVSVAEFYDFSFLPDGQVWYPFYYRFRKFNRKNKLILERHYITIEAEFNVDFPSDFFDIDLNAVAESGYGIAPSSDIIPELYAERSKLEDDVENVQCGTQSLLHVCEMFKIETTLENLNILANLDPEKGTSFLGLHQAATELGLNPKAVHVESSSLSKLSVPAITHMGGNHFMVAKEVVDGRVTIFDPNSDTTAVSLHTFLRLWTGNAMIFAPAEKNRKLKMDYNNLQSRNLTHTKSDLLESLSKDTNTPLESRSLQTEILQGEKIHDFGVISAGTNIIHEFILKNVSQENLLVSDVVSSCNCTTGLTSTKEIRPQDNLQLKVSFMAPMQHGAVNQDIQVYLASKGSGKQYVPVKLVMKGRLFLPFEVVPDRVFFEKVPFGESRFREINVRKRTEETVSLKGVKTDSEHIQAEVISTPTVDGGTKVGVTLSPNARIGRLKANIVWDYTYRDKPMQLRIPVTAMILGDFQVLPKQIFFGTVPSGKETTKAVILRTVRSKHIQIKSVNVKSEYVRATYVPIVKGKKYKIQAEILKNIPSGTIDDVITIMTDSQIQPKINVPLYAYVP